MKVATMKWLCLIVLISAIALLSGTCVQAQSGGQEAGREQAAGKEGTSKTKDIQKVFCAERSAAEKYLMVDAVNCNDVCDDVYRDYPCELQKRLSEGWKVTSVSVATIEVQRDPCECRVTGTETVLERD